jgi:hypothetical protein
MSSKTSKAAQQAKPPSAAQYVPRLDGKLPRRPGGRHAVKPGSRRDDDDPRDAPPPLGINQRIGFRIPEWAAITGTSMPSVYRGINKREIDIVEINGIKYVPRAYAIRKGLITADDTI